MGAAVIAASACARSGAGKLTVNIPKKERSILQVALPEAMLSFREEKIVDLANYSAIGIGPAMGINKASEKLLSLIVSKAVSPIILDADAITLLSRNKKILSKLPPQTILTPHPKEFDRLFGDTATEDRAAKAIALSKELNLIIVLKGHQTLIACSGEGHINTTGNAGLAKGGSGDALTGMITALLAQGYTSLDAALIGVYLHGKAADIALQNQSVESMLATDVIACIGKAFEVTRPL